MQNRKLKKKRRVPVSAQKAALEFAKPAAWRTNAKAQVCGLASFSSIGGMSEGRSCTSRRTWECP